VNPGRLAAAKGRRSSMSIRPPAGPAKTERPPRPN
jgi:hypothetical protein